MPGAERGHDQALHVFGKRVDEHVVIPERDRHQADPDLPAGDRAEERRPVAEPHRDIDLTLGDVTERPEARRDERCRAGGVRLRHPPGGMDLVVHDDHAAEPPCAAARRDPDRRQDVRRAVRSRQRRVAHGPGHDHRGIGGHQQVEQVGGLLDRVRALDHHHTGEAIARCGADRVRQAEQVAERQRGTGLVRHILDGQLHARVVQAGDRGQQIGRRQGRCHAFARPRLHGDGAAEGEHGHARLTRNSHQRSPLRPSSGVALASLATCWPRPCSHGQSMPG